MNEQKTSTKSRDRVLTEEGWVELAGKGITGLSRPERGWILAIVIMFLTTVVVDFFSANRQAQNLKTYLDKDQQLREAVEKNRSEELRRCQDLVKELGQALMRKTGAPIGPEAYPNEP